jgi:MYXO-CTERM domain-containing protein
MRVKTGKTRAATMSGVALAAMCAASAVLGACGTGATSEDRPDRPDETTASAHQALSEAFEASGRGRGVPRDLMVAIAVTEHGLGIAAQRDVAVEVEIPSAGPMQLRHGRLDTLARAATLLHTTELALRKDADLALDGGAAVLAELAVNTGAHEGDLASWQSAIEEMSGYADELRRHEYAHRVFAVLARGGTYDARDGEKITLPAHDLPPTLTLDISFTLHAAAGTPEYAGAEWIPTSCVDKCTTTRDGASVTHIVIHDTECNWDVAVSTLQNDPGKSVQYIVGTDGHVAQFIPESYTGWHSGNSYYNARSVGIEHVGYAAKPFTEKQYAASAGLVSYLRSKYNVPADRAHIIGHDQIPDGNVIAPSAPPCPLSPKACTATSHYGGSNNHSDPGIWEWPTYMTRIGGASKCNDVTPLFNCSYDKTRAFRCVNNAVEVLECTACDTQPAGQDDKCAVKPPPDPPFPPAPESSGTGDPPQPPPPAAPATPIFDEPVPEGGDQGCNASGRPGDSGDGVLLGPLGLLGLGLVVGVRRRRRARGRA